MSTLQIQTARVFAPLLEASRYKGAHGGRGSGKSHFFAERLIEICAFEPKRAACIREVQNSLKESVKQLLMDKIEALGVGHLFDVLDTEIRGSCGSLIIFRGMQSYNAQTIKSLEGYDIAWVEEAQALSEVSLRMLRPTIRKDGSELWFSWNPRHDTDAVDKLLRGPDRPGNAIVIEANWNDNPWFPPVLQEEMEADYAADPEMADHTWGGDYEIITEGAYYARYIADAEREGRIGDFPHNPARQVRTAWDIGVDDYTAVWFFQDDGKTVDVVDYYETSGDGAEQVVAAALPELLPTPSEQAHGLAEIGRLAPFKYKRHYLPHDVMVREWGGGGRTRFQTLQGLGVKPLQPGVATNPADRISAGRKLLPIVRFNNTKRVQVGLSRLRRYRRRWNDSMQTYTTPLHDENSHGSDAFGEFAINCGLTPQPKQEEPMKKRSGFSSARRPSGPSFKTY